MRGRGFLLHIIISLLLVFSSGGAQFQELWKELATVGNSRTLDGTVRNADLLGTTDVNIICSSSSTKQFQSALQKRTRSSFELRTPLFSFACIKSIRAVLVVFLFFAIVHVVITNKLKSFITFLQTLF